MDITPLIPKSANVIQSYSAEGVKVSGEHYGPAGVVMPEEVFNWAIEAQTPQDLSRKDFAFLEKLETMPEVLIVGTGQTMAFLSKDLRNFLQDKGLVPEMMDSGAAARTYNVLLSEGRHVCAALMPYK